MRINPKSAMFSVFFLGINEFYCACGQFLVESKCRRKFHKLRLDALSIPHCVIKKGRCHGARHGKTEVQREYHLAWNAWKRCCKKVDSQGEHFSQVFTIAFSEIQVIVNHNSLLAGPSKSPYRWTNWQSRITRTISLRGIQKIPRTAVSHIELVGQNRAVATSIRFSSCSLTQKTVSIVNQAKNVQNQHLHSNTGDGTLPQAIIGGTPKNWWSCKFSKGHFTFFCYSWFRLQSTSIHCNWRGVWRDTPHTSRFFCTVRIHHDVFRTTLTQEHVWVVRTHVICMVIHDEQLSVWS